MIFLGHFKEILERQPPNPGVFDKSPGIRRVSRDSEGHPLFSPLTHEHVIWIEIPRSRLRLRATKLKSRATRGLIFVSRSRERLLDVKFVQYD